MFGVLAAATASPSSRGRSHRRLRRTRSGRPSARCTLRSQSGAPSIPVTPIVCPSMKDRKRPVTSPFQPGFSYEGNPNEWGNAPQGFINKQNCGDHGPGCWSGYPKHCGGAPTHYNRFDGCQADHHCDETTDKCIRSKAGWTWPVSVCDGVDLTIGPSCSNGTNIGFPLCNRGNAELPAGTQIRIAIRNGNSYRFHLSENHVRE